MKSSIKSRRKNGGEPGIRTLTRLVPDSAKWCKSTTYHNSRRTEVLKGASLLRQLCANSVSLARLPDQLKPMPILFSLILVGGCSSSCDTTSLHAPSPSSVNASNVDCKPRKVEPLTFNADFDEQYGFQEILGARYGMNHLSCFRSIDDNGRVISDSCEPIKTEIKNDAK